MTKKSSVQKSKMTIDKLAQMTQNEFLSVRKDMDRGFTEIRQDLKHFATKEDLGELREEMRGDTAKILQSVDRIATKFDAREKDHAAHTRLHQRIADDLHGHDMRLKKLEVKTWVKL